MKPPLRVALIAASPEIIGGHSVQATALAAALREAGYEVSSIPIDARFPRGLKWIRRIRYARTLLNQALYLPSLLRIASADVVHVFSASYWSFLLAPAPAIVMAKLLRKPVVLHYHSGEADDHLTRWRRSVAPLLRMVDEIVVPSVYLQRVFESHGYRARVIPNLIDTARFHYRERTTLRPHLLSVRNLEAYYQVANTIAAFAELKKRFPDATLTVAGSGSEERVLRRFADELHVTGLRFLGRVEPDTLPAVYEAADIFVNSSVLDNQPVSILEAFASGLPVVSTPTGDIASMLRDGEAGLLVPTNDPSAMAAAITRLLENSELALRLTRSAREQVEHHTSSFIREQWISVYAAVIRAVQQPNTDRKLNVLLVVPWDQESGGVAAVVGYLARHLETEGHRVLFLHPGASEVVRQKKTKWGFPGVELKLRAPFNPNHPLRSVVAFLVMFPFTMFQLIRLLHANEIRVVNIHYPGEPCVYFAFCRWLLPVRLVISIHGMDAIKWDAPASPPSRALGLVFRAADLIVAPSWRFLRRCNDVLAPFSARRLAIPNGTDLSELEVSEPKDDSVPAPFILSVCSLDQWKGLDVLIRAIALLRDSGETTQLMIAGEGPQRAGLERLIAGLGLQQQVQLIGQQSRSSVARLLHQCTLFVLASRFETFGIAALEAMAVGKAVVGTAVDGILEILDDGETGILVEPEDPLALAAAIRGLLADAPLRERLGQAARARVKNQFQRQQMGENYTHAFQEVLAHGA